MGMSIKLSKLSISHVGPPNFAADWKKPNAERSKNYFDMNAELQDRSEMIGGPPELQTYKNLEIKKAFSKAGIKPKSIKRSCELGVGEGNNLKLLAEVTIEYILGIDMSKANISLLPKRQVCKVSFQGKVAKVQDYGFNAQSF